MKRPSRSTIVVGLLLLVLIGLSALAAAIGWLVRTEGGTRWLVARINEQQPALSIDRVDGVLWSGITVSGVRYVTDEAEIAIDRLSAVPVLFDLLDGTLTIEDARLGTVTYRQLVAADESEAAVGAVAAVGADAATPFSFPLTVVANSVQVEGVRVETVDAQQEFAETAFSVLLDGALLRITGLSTTTSGVAVQADADLDLTSGLAVATNFSWSTEREGMTWAGIGTANGTLAELAFTHRLSAPVDIMADGMARFDTEPEVQAVLRWENLVWPGQDIVQRTQGQAELTGWLDAFTVEGAGQVVIDSVEIDAAVTAAVTPETVNLETVNLASDYGSAAVNGSVLIDQLSWDLTISAMELDPSRYLTDWPAALRVDGRLRGSLAPALQWSFEQMSVAGLLREQAFTAAGSVSAPRSGSWQFDALEVDWAGNAAAVDGSIAESMDLAVSIDAPNIEFLAPDIDGHVLVEGRLGGDFTAPSFEGRATVDSFNRGSLSIERAALQGRVSGVEDAVLDLSFEAQGIGAAQPIAQSVSGSVTGRTQSHEIDIDIDSVLGAVSLSAGGGWIDNRWAGRIDALDIQQELMGAWALDAPVPVEVGAGSLQLERGCLRQAQANLCAGAEVEAGDGHVDLAIQSFDLASLQFLLDERVTVAGRYDAEVSLLGPFDQPTGTLSLTGESTLISISEAEAPLQVPIDRVELSATLNAETFEFSGRIRAPAETAIDIGGTVTDIRADDPGINVRLDGSWADLGFLSLLSPDVGQVSGLATLSLTLGGSFDSPEIDGQARWTGGEVAVPRWGLVVDNIDLLVTTPEDRLIDYALTANAGEGRIMLEGSTELDPAAMWPTRFMLRGEDIEAVQLPEAQVVISPDLEVFALWPAIEVSGVVEVPMADLRVDELPSQAVAVSPDVVIHGRELAAAQRPLAVHADLRVLLGEDVSFAGSGLDAELSGELDLDYRSGQAAVATGTVFLDGQYSTLGQSLELDRGQLIFSGSLTDPLLDVRGVRRFESDGGEVLVGVLVSGTVSAPVTRLFSEPAMSDGDIVSYLVVGRPLSDSSQENSEALQAAAVSLGLTQALPQIQHFGEAIGLDELGVRASQANTGELMAGKQISPRMYMRYTYGLMNRIGGLLLRFQLSDHLSLETRTGEFKAMDLLFMIERE